MNTGIKIMEPIQAKAGEAIPAFNNVEGIKEDLIAVLKKANSDFNKEIKEFKSYLTIWEALQAIRTKEKASILQDCLKWLNVGKPPLAILQDVDEAIRTCQRTLEQQKENGFQAVELKEQEYRINGIKKARIQLKRAIERKPVFKFVKC